MGHFPGALLDRSAENSTHDSIWRVGRRLGKGKRCNEAFQNGRQESRWMVLGKRLLHLANADKKCLEWLE
jgi:hypothetical protein